ncbi:SurA N-terminal domain-containing protein [Prevotella communis]|uniref:peptidylprolyl isomerase n=1 Tax=Prevotella communis TaxID=2913614 RepID=UPI001EDA28A1|nr:peptidylprolyl isomerase [Prevotella communis]UKK58521.1 SurA N-terminal domain-containing protein [Prevotella communis]UKK66459.1 SurA N-terminal domain-containing protein [Prevotella communis]UKK71402.1 SurA N-terminal domain-containing protein [Prevotella communis]
MAAIGKIRSWGPALVGILALGLVGFIAQDGFSTCRGRAQMDSSIAGSIDGDKIDIQEYQTLVGEYQELLKFLGQGNFDEEQLNSLRDEVWNTCVLNKMVEKEAKELGLTVTDDEVVKVLQEGTHPAIMQNPLLSRLVDPQTRTLDINKVNMYRENMKAQAQTNAQAAEEYEAFTHSWALAEKMLAQNLLTNKYQMLLAGCVLSNPVSAKAAFDNQNIESQALVASMSYSQINDNDVEVSEADLKAKYEELKEGFKNYQDSRDIKFVSVQVAASQKDRDELMKVMNKAYAELKGDSLAVTEVIRTSQSNVSYLGLPVSRAALPTDLADSITKMSVGQVTAPFESRDNTFNVVKFLGKTSVADSIEYRFISLVGMNGAAVSADSIVKAVNAGAPFDSIAKNYGQRAEKTWMRSTDYEQASTLSADDKQYFTTLLNAPVNEVKNLTFAQGNVVLQVTQRRGSVEKYDVAIVKRTIDFSNETYNEAYNKFSQFVSESQDLAGLQEKAAEYGYTVLDRTIRNTDHTIANIRSTHDALKWVFSEAEENQISQVYDRCGDNDRLLVVGLSKVNPKGYESMASVEETLKQEVLIDKKYAKLAEKLANVKTIAEAKAQGARVDTVSHITFASPAYVPGAMSPEVALSGAVAGVEKGAVSKAPVKGRSGAYFFQVLDRATRPGVQFNAAQQQQMLSQQGMQQTVRMAMQELYNNLDIKDNRYIFF